MLHCVHYLGACVCVYESARIMSFNPIRKSVDVKLWFVEVSCMFNGQRNRGRVEKESRIQITNTCYQTDIHTYDDSKPKSAICKMFLRWTNCASSKEMENMRKKKTNMTKNIHLNHVCIKVERKKKKINPNQPNNLL